MNKMVVVKILKVKLGLSDDQARARVSLGTWINDDYWESGEGGYSIKMMREEK
jgi:hypothetical protein